MDEDKLKRVFDQIKPTQEQERVMLDRLLTGQKEVKPVSRMKKMPAVLAAAAVLLLACAFTVATGLDQKFAALFGAGEQETRLIKDGVVQVDQRHTYENGWTVEVEQMLVDRYTLAVLLDVIAPEETALWGEDYSVLATSDIEPESEENGVGGWVSGSIVLPDDAPGDHHISILWYRGPTTYLQADAQTFLGGEFTITPLRLVEKTTFEIGKRHRVKVATSDGTEQLIILGHGALRLSASAFRAEVEQVEGEIAGILAQNNRREKTRPIQAAMDQAKGRRRPS